MKVSEVADKLGVSSDTIRYYTRIGLLSPGRTENGYNNYTKKDIQRLRFSLRAKQLGFKLSDIKALVEISEEGDTPCPKAREIIIRNLDKLRDTIEESQNLYSRMEKAVEVWNDMPDASPNGETICNLIDNWSEEVEK